MSTYGLRRSSEGFEQGNKEISITNIARMHREHLKGTLLRSR
jgi:hypothetical protein